MPLGPCCRRAMRPHCCLVPMRLLGSIPEEATYRSISSRTNSGSGFSANGIGDFFEDNTAGTGAACSSAANLSDPEDGGEGFIDEAALSSERAHRVPPSPATPRTVSGVGPSSASGRASARRGVPLWAVGGYLALLACVSAGSAAGGFIWAKSGHDRLVSSSSAASLLHEAQGAALQLQLMLRRTTTPCPGGNGTDGGNCTALARRSGWRGQNSSATESPETPGVPNATSSNSTAPIGATALTTISTSPRSTTLRRSCAAYGCVGFTPANACQCNAQCAQFGNCCSDYLRECGTTTTAVPATTTTAAPAPSCALYGCSEFDRTRKCQCDALCKRYGNCCPDAASRCHGHMEEQIPG
mmetsp:Transcript_142905/g.398160  ORF Transcript_142905/g.398160 Transcript_142905/m.398160 type:complete len:356 (-) Transcript_142905:137-1204(-)